MKIETMMSGKLGRLNSVPCMITAATVGFALSLATSEAQTRGGDQGASQSYQERQEAGAARQQDQEFEQQYTAVVRDPITGTWTRVTRYAAEPRPEMRHQAHRATQEQQEWRQTRTRPDQEKQAGRDRPSTRGAGVVSLQGQVQGFREITLRRGEGAPEDHTWVKINLESGYSAVVDLGPEKELADLELEQGDPIRVWGRHANIAGQNVLIANRIRVGNETISIDRDKRTQEVSGKIRNYREVNLGDTERENNLLVRFQMEDGRRIIADLGKDASLDDLEIERDAQVRITGERAISAGQQILVAKKITVDGDTTEFRDQDDY